MALLDVKIMDQESIVYGCIKDISGSELDSHRRKSNRLAMLSLPQADEWPYLNREMFSVPKVEWSSELYQTDVMHFGASYKAIEYEWNAWMSKFEELLENMYWVSAVVHLETELSGVHTFLWEANDSGHSPGNGIKNIRCQWTQEKTFL